MLKHIFVRIACVLLLSLLCLAAAAQTDSFVVKNIQIAPNNVSNNVYGIEIKFNIEYHGKSSVLSKVKQDQVALYFVGERGAVVKARSNSPLYKDERGFFRLLASLAPNTKEAIVATPVTVFLSYYAINLPEGEHTLYLKPRLKRPGREPEEPNTVFLGDNAGELKLEMPRLYKVTFAIDEVKAETTNLNGRAWDDNMGINEPNRSLPDLQYRLTMETNATSDELFLSSVQKNSLTASWPTPVPVFYLTADDKFVLHILDEDELKEERIGIKAFSAESLQEAIGQTDGLKFDRVSSLKLTSAKVE
jgi:hypothetical protein